MMAVFLGACVATAIMWGALHTFIYSRRVRLLPQRPLRQSNVPAARSGLQRIGMSRGLAGRRIPAVPKPIQRSVGTAVVVSPPLAVVKPGLAVLVAMAIIAVPVMRVRRTESCRRRRIERDMPMIIDLLCLAVRSGLTVGAALNYVVSNVDGPVCDVYRQGLVQISRGLRLAEVLEDCEDRLGESAMALTSALLSAERYGSPVGQRLAQLAEETRHDQERRAEQAARRLSVQLLFPLAGCILPAFVLLTAAPMLAGSVGSLATSFP